MKLITFNEHCREYVKIRTKETDFTVQVITRTPSKINKRNSVSERMLVDST